MQVPGRRGWETGKGETEGEATAAIGRGGQRPVQRSSVLRSSLLDCKFNWNWTGLD